MIVRAQAKLENRGDPPRSNQNLTPRKEYVVVGIDHECYRIVNDAGEPVLYDKCLFDVVDGSLPAGWSLREYDDGEYHLNPTALSEPGFYESYFDRDPEARRAFDATVAAFGVVMPTREPQHELARVADMLQDWSGSDARLVSFQEHYRWMTFHLTRSDRSGCLELRCGDTSRYAGAVTWTNADLKVVSSAAIAGGFTELLLRDERAGFELTCGFLDARLLDSPG